MKRMANYSIARPRSGRKLAIKKELEIRALRGRPHKLLSRVVRNWVSPASSKPS